MKYANYWVNSRLVVKCSYHVVQGNRFATPESVHDFRTAYQMAQCPFPVFRSTSSCTSRMPGEGQECNAAAAALKKNFKNTVNNLLNMGQ